MPSGRGMFALCAGSQSQLAGTSLRFLPSLPTKSRASTPRLFIKAMEARRLVEDTQLFCRQYTSALSQRVAHGVSLSCLSAALLAFWLSERGRITVTWKLTGTAIRQAQAVGLHRDPTWYKWEKMDAQECELRVLAWWYLILSDRQGYKYRPQTFRRLMHSADSYQWLSGDPPRPPRAPSMSS